MRRYDRLLGGFAVSLILGLGLVSRADAETTVHFVPQADINVFDPVTQKSPIVTQFAFLVYDQLFGIDSKYQPHPQMVDTYTASPDGKNYQFTLRAGLKFHDGTPVRSADAIASINRWAKADPAGIKMIGAGMKLAAVDDKTFTMTFDKPFGSAIDMMAKPSWPLFVFPEKDALKAPTDPIMDANGSGPFRFVRSEWVPGNKVVFEKNPDYVPRSEPADGYAGGKVVKIDRVEWDIIPDANTALSALKRGEVDAVENVPSDLLQPLSKEPDITLATFNKTGVQAYLRLNTLQPPFDNPTARQALLHLVNQQDYMASSVGDSDYWQGCWEYLMCGSRMGNPAGTEALQKGPDLALAKSMLQQGGYKGEKIVIFNSTGIPVISDLTQVLVQELQAIGANVDERDMDFNQMLSRRANNGPVAQGGWNIIPLWSFGPDIANPVTNQQLTANCDPKGYFGWACDPHLEDLRDQWAAAPDDAARKAIAEQIQLEALKVAVEIPVGQFYQPIAYRKSLTGIVQAPYFVMWNIEKKS